MRHRHHRYLFTCTSKQERNRGGGGQGDGDRRGSAGAIRGGARRSSSDGDGAFSRGASGARNAGVIARVEVGRALTVGELGGTRGGIGVFRARSGRSVCAISIHTVVPSENLFAESGAGADGRGSGPGCAGRTRLTRIGGSRLVTGATLAIPDRDGTRFGVGVIRAGVN